MDWDIPSMTILFLFFWLVSAVTHVLFVPHHKTPEHAFTPEANKFHITTLLARKSPHDFSLVSEKGSQKTTVSTH